jgi:valyl-tRNA synthetase
VPILEDETVDKDFGTGLMMVCTWGDVDDILKWE